MAEPDPAPATTAATTEVDPRYAAPCNRCGAVPTRRYIQGPKCREHTPAALLGQLEPGQRSYCAPLRCYCGEPECPAFPSYARGDDVVVETVVDARAKASGKRRSSAAAYRAAQAVVGEQQERERRLRLVPRPGEGS